MRGIAFIGGEGPGLDLCCSLVQGADIIAAADSGLIAAEDAGIKPGWIIGDMDSLDDLGRLAKYPPGIIRRFPRDKDYTDTELALNLLWEKGCDETWLVGGGGGRLDHLLALRSLFERELCPDRWITRGEDIYAIEAVKGGSGGVLKKFEISLKLEPASLVSVFPLGEGPWAASSSGLKWPLNSLPWNRGSFGISNVALDGNFGISAEQGRFMIVIPREQGESNGRDN
ncbi:thiamine diphosphokinase [Leadbettera azotonutricia]|uniref:Thiamine diphosphokinase n=1 Tax=Leadbettera azotonutricia (strain ATCC BAA-888 / DSM 13862 / ZAS-9) TaxID=545695 RepID=F5Y8J2_LEAAZ|nr:thiamine diphosphokinase [Leadbettera azotonutricia]AEF81639.1 thiamine diphosphokinase [Leadbettera azotonutricia ZAS-9]